VQWSILNIIRHLGDEVQDKVAAIFDLRTWTKILPTFIPRWYELGTESWESVSCACHSDDF
jgi:hypothetical protein